MTDNHDLATPDTLVVRDLRDGTHAVLGGPDQQLLVALFYSAVAAQHFVWFCLDHSKTYAGVKL